MQINAIITCVDYADYLSVSLQYNRHHFNRVMIVTSPADYETTRVAVRNGAEYLVTQDFFRDGSPFNKYRGLERGLDYFGEEATSGWLAIMDADVLWPKSIDWSELEVGNIYSPRRRMWDGQLAELPHEPYWKRWPLHRLHTDPRWHNHLSGYTQLFHGSDPALGVRPWHRMHLPTAQGGDTSFMEKWPEDRRLRPSWECLHLGPPRINWEGRKSPPLKA